MKFDWTNAGFGTQYLECRLPSNKICHCVEWGNGFLIWYDGNYLGKYPSIQESELRIQREIRAREILHML